MSSETRPGAGPGDIRWRLARHVLDTGGAQVQQALARMCRELADGLAGTRWSYIIASRHGLLDPRRAPADPIGSWTPIHIELDPRLTERERLTWTRLRTELSYRDDPGTRELVGRAGRVRVQRARHFYAALDDVPVLELLTAQRLRDRIVGAAPMTPGLEVYVIVDRTRGEPFSAVDAVVVEAAMPVFARVAYRLCLQRGLLEDTESLTPRERAALAELLAGRSEAECAAALGLRRGSAHQMVVRIFRKLGVRSRAELMARCLGSVRDEIVPLD